MSVNPTVLIAKITMRTISGARMRRMTRKIVAEACRDEAIGTRQRGRRLDPVSTASRRYQNASNGFVTWASRP